MTTGTAQFEAAIQRIAPRQHGLVTRAQLLGAGLSARMVQRRLASGRLQLLHRGVYHAGPLETRFTRPLAAVLACGGPADAAVGHLTAAGLWGVLTYGGPGPIDVSIAGASRGRRPGIRAHRVGRFWKDEVTVLERVPITTPARTLLDLSAVVGSRDLGRAVARALRNELTTRHKLEELIERYPRRRGAHAFRALLSDPRALDFTRSPAEDRFRDLVSEAKLPMPEANRLVHGHEVDFFWPAERVIVEVDGFAHHRSRSTFEKDRFRDAELSAAGCRVVRVTWRQLSEEPTAVAAMVAQTLARAGRR